MKILISFLLIFLVSSYCQAQTLHAIIFANTECPGETPGQKGIGPYVTVDYERMSLEISSIASSINYNLKKYYYYGKPERFNCNNLKNVIHNLRCGADDIVFFYYSGHGLRFQNEETQFPEMCLRVTKPAREDLFPLYDVYQILCEKKPRLTIVLGDMCNSTITDYKSVQPNKSATIKSASVDEVYQNLFLNVKGGFIATSSKPGQTSGCCSFEDGSEAGSIFTCAFLLTLGTYVNHGSLVSWQTLLNDASIVSQKIAEKNGSDQNPVYITNDLVSATPPTVINGQITGPVADDERTISMDEIASQISVVANGIYKPADRIKGISTALRRFNNNARIQVVGQDCHTIVNTTTAKRYLDYLSVATNMDRIAVIDQKVDDSGKFTYLKVHEIHRQ